MQEDVTKYIQQVKNETDFFSKAKLLKFLVNEKNFRIIDLAKALGKTSSYICHIIRLTSLPDMIIDGYYSKLISLSHLFTISRIKDKAKLLEIYEHLLKNNFTVQETEDLVRETLYQIKNVGKRLEKTELESLIGNIKDTMKDIEIKAIQTRIRGKMVIEIKVNLENTTQALRDLLIKLA